MSKRSFAALYRMLSGFIALCLLSADLAGAAALVEFQLPQPLPAPATLPPAEEQALFRTTVTLHQPRDLERVRAMGAVVLEAGETSALLLVTAVQLEDLARLRFEPTGTDELGSLAAANAATMPWLAESLAPALATAAAAQQAYAAARAGLAATAGRATAAGVPELAQPAAALAAVLAGLSAEQLAAAGEAISPDYDGDGLSDTREQYWCTNYQDNDSDDDGKSDGAEIQAILDWVNNRRTAPPDETPWSNWPLGSAACPDKDLDSVPNLAERLELGLHMDWESTDWDKYDDGQEVFGITYCPGGDFNCNYGSLPRTPDSGFIPARLPGWVKAPANHPLVAAFPVPVIEVQPSSLKVETVTTVTTDHVITSGTQKSYSTANTTGTSTSVAEGKTWNDWQEVSTTTPVEGGSAFPPVENPQFAKAPGLVETAVVGLLSFVGKQVVEAGADCAKDELRYGRSSCRVIAGTVYDNRQVLKDKAITAVKKTVWDENQSVWKNALNLAQCILPPAGAVSCTAKAAARFVTSAGPELLTKIRKDLDNYSQNGGAGQEFSEGNGNEVGAQQGYEISFPLPRQLPTVTQTTGKSWGGSLTTTTEQYQEVTITNAESFSNEESWGNATAVDSAHAADLWFTYTVRNDGTEYAKEIGELVFNLYIGDDPNPAYTYFVSSDIVGDVKFRNTMPGAGYTYTSRRIPLSLEQMKLIDLGAPVRIVVASFDYGVDKLFYEAAVASGVRVAVEDGVEDGDQLIDSYLLPTWGDETLAGLLKRYFPYAEDPNGALIAIWTPEYQSTVPVWCESPIVPAGAGQGVVWCKHSLLSSDWWNIYADGLTLDSEAYQDSLAVPGGVVVFRFNQDSDYDGYSDRTEDLFDTDSADAEKFPRPEMIAGVYANRTGNQVVAALSLLNAGLYDANSVEAMMIAPDDSIEIDSRLVGGGGRVRAQRQVVVGGRIVPQSPLPSVWTASGHALPTTGGYYQGSTDRTYTFTVNCSNPGGCTVGSGTWNLNWSDGAGGDPDGSLAFGIGYASPTLQNVGTFGLKLGLLSGTVANGQSFTVTGQKPRDTFQYTINREPYTPPLVIVSYNDPQGNHRFLIPPEAMNLATPADNLAPFAGRMILDPGVQIVTDGPHQTGANTTDLLINNPSGVTLDNAHLFLEFVDPNGNVVLEVPVQADLPSGPTVVPIAWNTNAFTPAYQANQDYIVMAFWTDYQGNITDTAARPLSSFQDDPNATLAFDDADLTWDFGTAAQGTLLQRRIVLGSTGYQSLLTHIDGATGVSVAAPAESTLGPADMGIYTLQINTADLAVGAYNKTITLRTSDAANAEKTLTITGTVTPFVPDDSEMVTVQPLDWLATLTGNQGDWVAYTHTLGPNPESLHPVWVRSQDRATLYGVGRYATAFNNGTAPGDMFGDGSDGDLTISQNTVDTPIDSSVEGTSGTTTLIASNPLFAAGQVILIHQSRGAGAGTWELNKIATYAAGVITTENPLEGTYTDSGVSQAQVRVVPQYHDVTVLSGVTWSSKFWDGNVGGIIAFLSNGKTTINGNIEATRRGFRQATVEGGQGEGTNGPRNTITCIENGNGGGGGQRGSDSLGGGGGGNGSIGQGGHSRASHCGGYGGASNPDQSLATMYFGGGGGAGAGSNGWTTGGDGGGIIVLIASDVTVTGLVTNNGQNGSGGDGNDGTGGGGAGGSILIRTRIGELGNSRVLATGGTGGPGYFRWGGYGSVGIIKVEYCDQPPTGLTIPDAFAGRINCYIAEQIETEPFTQGRLNLSTNGGVYAIEYGRRFVLPSAGDQPSKLRVPAGFISSATLSALVSGVGSGNVTFKLDVGDDGTWDWETTQAVSNAAELNSPNLNQAFNAYWGSHGAPATGTLDVPVRVYLSKAGQVLLTDFAVTYLATAQGNAAAFDSILAAAEAMGVVVEAPAGGSDEVAPAVNTTPTTDLLTCAMPVAVTDTTTDKHYPAVAVEPTGAVHTAWTDAPVNYDDHRILYAYRSPAGQWSAPEVVAAQRHASMTDIVVDNVGTVHVMWAGESAGVFEVYYSVKLLGGSWSAPVKLSGAPGWEGGAGGQLAVGPDGVLHVVFHDHIGAPGSNLEIYYRTKAPGGSWSTAVNLSLTDGVSYGPYIVVDSSNNAHVAWSESFYPDVQIMAVSKPAGGNWTTTTTISGREAGINDLVGDSQGNVYAFWHQSTPQLVYYSMKSPGGGWSVPEGVTDIVGVAPVAAVDAGGALHVVWGSAAYARKAPGQSWQVDWPFNGNNWYGNFGYHRNAIGLDANGDLHLIWNSNPTGDVEIWYTNCSPTAQPAIRFARLEPNTSYGTATVDLRFGEPNNGGSVSFTVDVGADGSVEWSSSVSAPFPAVVTSPNLAADFNNYLQSHPGEQDVPLRILTSPVSQAHIVGLNAIPANRPDATLSAGDITFTPSNPVEGEVVTIATTLRNTGNRASDGVTAAFFATLPGSAQEWYIGSAFVPNIPAGGTAAATLEWDTLGFNGATTVRVEIDPYNRLAEVSDGNNEAGKSLTVRRRPELAVAAIALSDPEPVAGQALSVAVIVANAGQAQAAAATCALYLGNPDDGGALLAQQPCGPIAGGGQATVTFAWTPAAPGPARLFARLDTANVVRESDESNNDDWYDAYAGFAEAIQIDSGAAGDAAYTAAAGYGAIDAGTADDLFSADACSGAVTDEERTMRGDPDGSVTYRFDHLLPAATATSPGHFYHLDLLLLECDGEGRQQTVYVDDIAFRGPYDLGGGAVQRLTLLLDPAFYADHTITVKVKTPVGTPGGALVSSIRLTNIDYRYADAGGAKDVLYPGGPAGYAYGWLNDDGSLTAFTSWGPLPFQTARRDGNDNDVDYRFDGLDPARQYRVNVTLFNGAANTYQESVLIDDLPTAIAAVGLNDLLPHYGSADVPASTYSGDGSIVVKIRRDNGGITLVSEIALEEVTQATGQTNTPPNVPASPSPADNATGVATNPTLSWTGGDPDAGDSVTYDVYLDTVNPPAQQRADNQTELTFSAGGLAANTLYYWRIVATDNRGATTNGPVWRFTTAAAPNNAPTPPANLSPSNGATNVSKTPQLCWSASSDPDGDPVTYDVYLGASNPPATAISSNQSGTCYTSGALAGHTTYYWYIVAEDNRGGSTPGVVWSFTTLNTAPTAPSGPNPANGTMGVSTTTQICWSASTDSDNDSVLYDIHLGTTNPPIAEYSGYNGTCYTPLLAANTTYYWRVTAKDAFGGATAGPVWSFTTAALPNNPPNAPTNPSPAPGATGVALTAGLSWSGSDPENDPLTYEVRFGLTNPPPAVVANQSATAYDPAGNLAAHTTYYWQIVAKDTTHPNGTAGPVWSFTTANTAPTTPSNPTPANGATNVQATSQVCWTASTDADSDAVTYDVAFGTANPPPAVTSGQSTTCYDPPGDLSPSTPYYWKVTAKDAFGGSTAGPVWSFTTTGGGTTFLDVFYISPSANVTVGGIAAQGADVLRYTKSANTWQMLFDGSEHGLTKNITAFALTDDGSLLFVLAANQAIAGLGTATPFDVVKFTPQAPGIPMGAGTFSMFFQGQLKGLTAAGEKIDAIDLVGNRLLLSTGGAASVPKPGGSVLKATDEDIFVYNLGTNAYESALLIDGSKMTKMAAEDINGLWDDPQSNDYYVTILGAFNLGGVAGNDKSIVKLTPNGGATVFTPSLVSWLAAGATLPTGFKIDGLEMAR